MAPVRRAKRRPAAKTAKKTTLSFNAKSNLKTFKDLKKKIDTTWAKLQRDVKRKNLPAILKGKDELTLLLGECSYMKNEFIRCRERTKSR